MQGGYRACRYGYDYQDEGYMSSTHMHQGYGYDYQGKLSVALPRIALAGGQEHTT